MSREAAVLRFLYVNFRLLKAQGRRKPPPCSICVSAFGFYFCFFFFSVTVVPITAPPLTNNSAIHSIRLLLSLV